MMLLNEPMLWINAVYTTLNLNDNFRVYFIFAKYFFAASKLNIYQHFLSPAMFASNSSGLTNKYRATLTAMDLFLFSISMSLMLNYNNLIRHTCHSEGTRMVEILTFARGC